MHLDPDLNLSAATGALLGTAADLKARLDEYLKYPGKAFQMCRRWWPQTYRHAISKFLQATTEELDVGFSLELQRLALAQEGEMQQRAFLSSDKVQKFLEASVVAFFSHSLAAERKAAEVKRREHSSCKCIPRSAL